MTFTIKWPQDHRGHRVVATGVTPEELSLMFPEGDIMRLFNNFKLSNIIMKQENEGSILILKE